MSVLASRFKDLEGSGANPDAVRHLKQLLEHGADFECFKINAFRVAEAARVSHREAVTAFLYATRLGLFDLNWDIHCPSCKGLPEFHRHLMQLSSKAHCGLCKIDWNVDLAEQIEVTFTAHPEARKVAYQPFHERAYPDQLLYFREMGQREGRGPSLQGQFAAGETRDLAGELGAGLYEVYVPGHMERGALLRAEGERSPEPTRVDVEVGADGAVNPKEISVRPGAVRLAVHFGYPEKWAFAVFKKTLPRNWVSAAYVTSLQDFRDLFSSEFLAPDVSFAIQSTTLVFTDIKGSTEMYERLGDAKAYRLVQDHFRLMTDAIRRHEGGIVKTIGDAVMASFPVTADAVRAACEIQVGFSKESQRLEGIEVKIGLHRGPAIAVTTNRALDFFGRTVNIAARVQGESQPGEVLLSDAVWKEPAVGAFLAEQHLQTTRREATLKGIAGKQTLHSVRPRGA